MHEVRGRLGKTSSDPASVLSQEVLQSCENAAFWRDLVPYSPDATANTAIESGANASFFESASTPAEPTNLIGG
jgi:hypothetical protein